jgi:peptidyl-prolyl cis-trans isomerase B (cyclophilin B)
MSVQSGYIAAPVPAPAPYGHAAAPYGYAPTAPRTNSLAVVALVLGLVGVSLGGVICGHFAISQIRRTGERGHGMAVAGLILGYIGIALSLVLLVVAFSAASQYGGY